MQEFSFFDLPSPVSLADIAKNTGCTLPNKDHSKITVSAIGPIENAPADSLCFLDNVKYVSALKDTNAKAVICSKKYTDKVPAGIAVLLSPLPDTGTRVYNHIIANE